MATARRRSWRRGLLRLRSLGFPTLTRLLADGVHLSNRLRNQGEWPLPDQLRRSELGRSAEAEPIRAGQARHPKRPSTKACLERSR